MQHDNLIFGKKLQLTSLLLVLTLILNIDLFIELLVARKQGGGLELELKHHNY